MVKAVIAAFVMVLLAAPAANARGGHGGGHSSSHVGASYHAGRGYSGASGVHYTHAYVTGKGRFVGGHWATNRNKTRNDNFSTKGNRNPFTGKKGAKPRD